MTTKEYAAYCEKEGKKFRIRALAENSRAAKKANEEKAAMYEKRAKDLRRVFPFLRDNRFCIEYC